MTNSNYSFSNYIKYDNLVLNDGTNLQDTVNNENDCFNKCSDNPNCQGVNIIKNNQNKVSEDGYNYQNVLPLKCEYINNICYSNTKNKNTNSTFYAKKNNLHLENNTPYILKNNNICLSLNNNNNMIGGSSCDNIKNITPVLFDTSHDTIKIDIKGDTCLNFDNNNLNLLKCNTFSPNQKFIYDNVYNTLRPYNDTTQCVNAKEIINNGITNYKFSTDPCKELISKNDTKFENYHSYISDDSIEYFQNKDYSTDMTYYIIYITLLCMIAFLVIISSK